MDHGKSFWCCWVWEVKTVSDWLTAKQNNTLLDLYSLFLLQRTWNAPSLPPPNIPVPNPFIKTLTCKTASLASGLLPNKVNNFPCRDKAQQTSGGRAKNGLFLPTHLQSVLFCGETQAMPKVQSLFLATWMCSCCHSPSHPTRHHAHTWSPTWAEQCVEIHVSNSSNYFPLFAIWSKRGECSKQNFECVYLSSKSTVLFLLDKQDVWSCPMCLPTFCSCLNSTESSCAVNICCIPLGEQEDSEGKQDNAFIWIR